MPNAQFSMSNKNDIKNHGDTDYTENHRELFRATPCSPCLCGE